jgi:hypothetical protein
MIFPFHGAFLMMVGWRGASHLILAKFIKNIN